MEFHAAPKSVEFHATPWSGYWSCVTQPCLENLYLMHGISSMSRLFIKRVTHLTVATTARYASSTPPTRFLPWCCYVVCMKPVRKTVLQAHSLVGFCRGRSTEDALHCAQRAMELAWSQKGGQLHLLALDWAKAFDSISPDSLLRALRCFGIPEPVVTMIASIHSNRVFQVRECGTASAEHRLRFGICQGCPLSPFLFVVLMSVIVSDSVQKLSEEDQQLYKTGKLVSVLYADDTLLIGSSDEKLLIL